MMNLSVRQSITADMHLPIMDVAAKYDVHRTTVQRIWSRAKSGRPLSQRVIKPREIEPRQVWRPIINPAIKSWLLRKPNETLSV